MKTAAVSIAAVALAAMAAPAAPADVTLPKGTSIEVRIVTPFDSDTTAKGKEFQAAVLRPVLVGGRLVIPQDAVVIGEITHVRSPRDGAKSGAIAVKFERVEFPGRSHDIEGVLTSFHADERKQIIEHEAKLTTGRKVDVIFIGRGTETNLKASTLVGTSEEGREELADNWAVTGLGPPLTSVSRGTTVAMRLDNTLTLPELAGAPAAGDRNILVAAGDVKRAQEALKTRGLYAGEATGILDPATRRAIAAFQIDAGQPATGDLDDVTAAELAVR
jgi:hypothetical protein